MPKKQWPEFAPRIPALAVSGILRSGPLQAERPLIYRHHGKAATVLVSKNAKGHLSALTPPQQTEKDNRDLWATLTTEQRATWNRSAARRRLPPYKEFCRINMLRFLSKNATIIIHL
jgi:hypothetical protein